MKSFAGLSNQSSAITENLGKPVPNRIGHQTRASTMKTLLTICLSAVAFALVSLAQVPPPAQAPPATGGTSPAAQAPTNPAAAAQQPLRRDSNHLRRTWRRGSNRRRLRENPER